MELMNSINLITNIITSFGTLITTTIAIWLLYEDCSQKIDCAFMWERITNDKPTIFINNFGNYTVIIKRIEFYFNKQHIGTFDMLGSESYEGAAIVKPKEVNNICVDPGKFTITGKARNNPDTIYKFTAVIVTTNNKKYKSSYRYCYNDILGMTFMNSFDNQI